MEGIELGVGKVRGGVHREGSATGARVAGVVVSDLTLLLLLFVLFFFLLFLFVFLFLLSLEHEQAQGVDPRGQQQRSEG